MKSTPDDIHARIESLDALPTSMSVAIRLIELSMNPDAEISEYVNLIRLDPGLSAKLIAVANSSWCGVAQKVTQTRQAVTLLGTANVRVLAVSYCVAGIHRSWQLTIENAQAYWEASLCKATAARLLAGSSGDSAEDAFTLALLQDIGLGLLVALGGQTAVRRLLDPDCDIDSQLQFELEHFGVDHAHCGGLVAQKLGLPEPFRTAVRLHHSPRETAAHLGSDVLAAAITASSLLPHDLRCWRSGDLSRVEAHLAAFGEGHWPSAAAFLERLRIEHYELVNALGHTPTPWPALAEAARTGIMT